MKSFDTQSLSLPNTEHADISNKSFDTQSLNPKILMDMSTMQDQKPVDTCPKLKYRQTIISVSQIKEEQPESQTEIECLAPYEDCPKTESSVDQTDALADGIYDCSSPYPQRHPTVVRSKVITESQISETSSNINVNSNHSSVMLQNYDSSFVDIPLAPTNHNSQIQIVPLNAFLHIPQNSQFITASREIQAQMYIQEPDIQRDRIQYANKESCTDYPSPMPMATSRLDSQAKAPVFSDKQNTQKHPEHEAQTVHVARLDRVSKSPNANNVSQVNTLKKHGPTIDESSITLYERASCEDVLMENSKSYTEIALNDALLDSLNKSTKTGSGPPVEKRRTVRKIFRIFNFLRALAISVFVFVNSSKQLQDETIIALGARNILIASIVFAALDIIVAFIRLFPKVLWCCWDVRNWDPFSKTYTVWALIANHDLLIDVIPVVLNVIVRIYVYRMSEILSNPSIKDSIYNLSININQIDDVFRYQNLIILMSFVATLVYQVAFHAASVMFYLSFDKRAAILGSLVFLKSLLLLFDIITNGMLFYKVLVYKGIDLFDLSGLVAFTISIVAPSPIVTLITNGLVNIPLHFSNFRMRLGSRSTSWFRVLKASSKQAFHILLIPVFLYLFYSSAILIYVLKEIQVINTAVENLLPNSSFFGWTSGRDILLGMIWTNVVINYLGGMLLWILWIVWSVFSACLKS